MTHDITMLELVTAVSEYADTEDEVIATVVYMINSGSARLCGNFAGATFDVDDLSPHSGEIAA